MSGGEQALSLIGMIVFVIICIAAALDLIVMIVAAFKFEDKDSPEVLQTSVFILLGCAGAMALFFAGAISRFWF